jgi:hypothetical protein
MEYDEWEVLLRGVEEEQEAAADVHELPFAISSTCP